MSINQIKKVNCFLSIQLKTRHGKIFSQVADSQADKDQKKPEVVATEKKADAPKKKGKKGKGDEGEENQVAKVQLGPQVTENELVFGVAHILATWNDTFIHITDLSGRETYIRVTGLALR